MEKQKGGPTSSVKVSWGLPKNHKVITPNARPDWVRTTALRTAKKDTTVELEHKNAAAAQGVLAPPAVEGCQEDCATTKHEEAAVRKPDDTKPPESLVAMDESPSVGPGPCSAADPQCQPPVRTVAHVIIVAQHAGADVEEQAWNTPAVEDVMNDKLAEDNRLRTAARFMFGVLDTYCLVPAAFVKVVPLFANESDNGERKLKITIGEFAEELKKGPDRTVAVWLVGHGNAEGRFGLHANGLSASKLGPLLTSQFAGHGHLEYLVGCCCFGGEVCDKVIMNMSGSVVPWVCVGNAFLNGLSGETNHKGGAEDEAAYYQVLQQPAIALCEAAKACKVGHNILEVLARVQVLVNHREEKVGEGKGKGGGMLMQGGMSYTTPPVLAKLCDADAHDLGLRAHADMIEWQSSFLLSELLRIAPERSVLGNQVAPEDSCTACGCRAGSCRRPPACRGDPRGVYTLQPYSGCPGCQGLSASASGCTVEGCMQPRPRPSKQQKGNS